MNDLSMILLPWLKDHGYEIGEGGANVDLIEIVKAATAVGWIYQDHVEVGTKLVDFVSTLSTWYGSPYTVLRPAEPDFFAKLLVALEFASKVVHNYEAEKQAENIPVPERRD